MDAKTPQQSLTLWTAVIMALAPLVPPVGAFVSANPAVASAIAGGIMAALRFVTKKPLRF